MAKILKNANTTIDFPIVFIHGWGLNAGVWQPLIEQLEANFSVMSIDLPGYGQNHALDCQPYSLNNIATQICAQVAVPAIYVGWSLGGLVANQIAIDYPDKVKALVNVASTPYFVKQPDWPGIEEKVLTLFHRQLSQDTHKTIENFLKIQAMGSPHIRQDIKRIRDLIMQYPMADQQILEQSLTLLETTDQRKQLSLIHCPYLRLYGKLDGLVPKAVITQIEQLAPNSTQHIFERSSHAPFISEMATFSCYLSTWLNQVIDEHESA